MASTHSTQSTHSKNSKVSKDSKDTKDSKTTMTPFECYICNISFESRFAIVDHMKQHGPLRNEKCEICNEMCTAKELQNHLCDGIENTIQCEYCIEFFGATTNLIRHIETVHKTEKILHRCDMCRQFFGMEKLRDLHKMNHKEQQKDVENFICEVCSMGFSDERKFQRHQLKHIATSRCNFFGGF